MHVFVRGRNFEKPRSSSPAEGHFTRAWFNYSSVHDRRKTFSWWLVCLNRLPSQIIQFPLIWLISYQEGREILIWTHCISNQTLTAERGPGRKSFITTSPLANLNRKTLVAVPLAKWHRRAFAVRMQTAQPRGQPRDRASLDAPTEGPHNDAQSNVWLGIPTEDLDEAVQSSDLFPFIIHPTRGDWGAGLLSSQRPKEPYLFSWAEEMPCSTVRWITGEWKQKALLLCEWAEMNRLEYNCA